MDAEIEVLSGESTELKRSPFNVLRLLPGVSSLPISTLPVHSPEFFPRSLWIFPVLAVANAWFLCRPAE